MTWCAAVSRRWGDLICNCQQKMEWHHLQLPTEDGMTWSAAVSRRRSDVSCSCRQKMEWRDVQQSTEDGVTWGYWQLADPSRAVWLPHAPPEPEYRSSTEKFAYYMFTHPWAAEWTFFFFLGLCLKTDGQYTEILHGQVSEIYCMDLCQRNTAWTCVRETQHGNVSEKYCMDTCQSIIKDLKYNI